MLKKRAALPPVLLDSSFLIALEREIEAGRTGPAMRWLRAARSCADRPLLVSCVSVAEFLEGFTDPKRGLAFIVRYIPQNIGFRLAVKCAELQRRAKKTGKRFGENDAWQLAFAECASAAIVGCDRRAFSHLGGRYEEFTAA
jgi:predicted nucleic acid-binding protein